MTRKFKLSAALAVVATALLTAASATSSTTPTADISIGQTATISWTAPTTYTTGAAIASGTTITYDLYAAAPLGAGTATCAGASYGSPTSVTGTSFTTAAYTSGGVYCYYVTALVNGAQSAPSNTVEAIVSLPVPNAPAATIQ